MMPVPAAAALIQQAMLSRRHADAARMLDGWLEANPHDKDGWFNLGYSRRLLLEPQPALTAYGRALAEGVSAPEQAHLNIAAIHSEVLQDVAAARASLHAALAIEPRFVLAWQNLGQLEEDAGDAVAARAAYQSALQHHPGLARAHARIAGIDSFEGHHDVALARVEAAGRQATSNDDLIELGFASANALDALGRYDAAYDQAIAVNELQKHTSPLRYSHAEATAQIDALIRLFPSAPLPSPQVRGVQPIFICGLFRSGSTLLESLLGRHGITMGGELAFTPWFMSQHGAEIAHDNIPAMAQRFGDDYSRFVRDVLSDAAQFTDKRLDNFLYLGFIKQAFPDALIINTLRNPIDNFLSMFFLPFADNITYANDFDDMLHYYRLYRRIMAHWDQCFGADIINIHYDMLVQQPEAVMAGLAQRLGLTAETRPVADQIIRTASVWQVRQPVHARSSGRWRNYGHHIGDLADELRAEFPDVSQ